MADIRKTALTRYKIVAFFVTIVFFAAIGKAFTLKLIDGDKYNEAIKKNSERSVVVEANRGDILAADGRKLACSVPSYRIFMDPCADGLTSEVFNSEIDDLSNSLSRFCRDKSAADYRNMICKARLNGRRYLPICNRRLTYNELK